MAWKKLGDGTGAGTSSIDVSIQPNDFIFYMDHLEGTGGVSNAQLRFNNDTSTSYADRRDTNGTNGTDITQSIHSIDDGTPSAGTWIFSVMYIANINGEEKLSICDTGQQVTAGAANIPTRRRRVGKFDTTVGRIREINTLTASNNWSTSSNVSILGTSGGETIGGIGSSTGGWKELGRTTLSATGDDIDVSEIPNKKYYMQLTFTKPSGDVDTSWRIGSNGTIDTGSNYANRRSLDGASDVTTTGSTHLLNYGMAAQARTVFGVSYYANIPGEEKLMINCAVDDEETSGAGTAPARYDGVGKHVQTTDPIDIFRNYNQDSGSFGIGSETIILGWDPDDIHTDNFWEELAYFELPNKADDLVLKIPPRKYLRLQFYGKGDGNSNYAVQFNDDAGTNYTKRRSVNGAADVTENSRTDIDFLDGLSEDTNPVFYEAFILNDKDSEKLIISHLIRQNSDGAGNPPERNELVFKWANSTEQITKIHLQQLSTGPYNEITRAIVWGHD